MLLWGSVILIGISTFIILNTFFQDESQYKASEQLEEGTQAKEDWAQYGVVLKYSRPFFKRYVTPVVSSLKKKKKIRERYKKVLANAGVADVMTPDDFYSFKLFLIVGFPIVFIGLRWFLEESWPLTYIYPIAVIGYFYPDFWIKGKIQKRKEEVLLAMPFAVDMLALSCEAGLDFAAAMVKVIEKSKPSPLTDEFKNFTKETRVGSSRAEALRNMAWRVDLIQLSSFCATLIAADSVGASIGPILKSLAQDVRQKKSSEAEKKGAQAATKILFPMLMLIMPAVFIIIAAPIVVQFITGG